MNLLFLFAVIYLSDFSHFPNQAVGKIFALVVVIASPWTVVMVSLLSQLVGQLENPIPLATLQFLVICVWMIVGVGEIS